MKTIAKAMIAILTLVSVSFVNVCNASASNDPSSSSSNKGAVVTSRSSNHTSHVNYVADYYDNVSANATDTYQVRLRAGQTFSFHLIGDGDTDLDIRVYDWNNNLVYSGTDHTVNGHCTITPSWSGQYTIKIMNRGNVFNSYRFWIQRR